MHRYSHIFNIKIKHNQFSFLEIELIVCGTVGSCKLEALIGFPQSLADGLGLPRRPPLCPGTYRWEWPSMEIECPCNLKLIVLVFWGSEIT